MNPIDRHRQNYRPAPEQDKAPPLRVLIPAFFLTLIWLYLMLVMVLSW